MKLHLTLPALALVALAASAPVIEANASSARAVETALDEDDALHEAMETLKTGQRAVKKMMADPVANQAELMRSLRSMEGAVVVAYGETPEHPEGLAGKDLELFNIGYKAQMADLLGQLLAMQTATLNGDKAALETCYEELSKIKKTGHTDFRVDD